MKYLVPIVVHYIFKVYAALSLVFCIIIHIGIEIRKHFQKKHIEAIYKNRNVFCGEKKVTT